MIKWCLIAVLLGVLFGGAFTLMQRLAEYLLPGPPNPPEAMV